MTAPRWIAEALDAACDGARHLLPDVRKEAIAAALLERLPLEAIAREVPGALDDIAEGMYDRVVADIVRVLTDGDPEVVELTELYQGATRALDAAGAPYETGGGEQLAVRLNLAGRILWLVEQRPTRLDLQRVEGERDAARALMDATVKLAADRAAELDRMTIERDAKQKAIDDAAPIMAELIVATRTAEQQRDAWRRRYDECIVTITANQQSIAALIDESESRRRERDELAIERGRLAVQIRASTVALDAFEVPRSIEPLDIAERDSAPLVTLELDGRIREMGNTLARVRYELATERSIRDRVRATVADLTEQRAATERALTRAGAPMDELTNEQGAVWLHREIDALKERLLKAETERDALRGLLASG